MTQPLSINNTRGQSLDVIVDDDGTIRLKKAVGVKTPGGLTNESAWQGVASHIEGDTFVADDGVLVGAGVDGSLVVHPTLVDVDGRVVVRLQPASGGVTDRSGAITVGGTQQTLAAVKLDRKYLLIQNVDASEEMWINFTTTAVADKPSIKIPAGGGFVMEGSYVTSELVSVVAATTGHKWTAKEA